MDQRFQSGPLWGDAMARRRRLGRRLDQEWATVGGCVGREEVRRRADRCGGMHGQGGGSKTRAREWVWASLLSMGSWERCRRERQSALGYRQAECSCLLRRLGLRSGHWVHSPLISALWCSPESRFYAWLQPGITTNTAVVVTLQAPEQGEETGILRISWRSS